MPSFDIGTLVSSPDDDLRMTYEHLLREVGRLLCIGRDPDDWTSDEEQDVADILETGLRRFYYPMPLSPEQPRHVWSFLCPTATLSTTSGTDAYDLPDGFGDMFSEGFTFSSAGAQPRVTRVTVEALKAMQAQASRSGAPQYYALRAKTPSAGTHTTYQVVFYPTPDATYSLSYQYNVLPSPLSEENPLPLGGAPHAQTILEACLAAAEKTLHDEEGVHEKRFRELLGASILYDQSLTHTLPTTPWEFENEASGLVVNKAYLKRLIGVQLKLGAHPSGWNHEQAQRVKLALETGLRKFYRPIVLPNESYAHEWSFLVPRAQLTTVSGEYVYDLPEDFAMLEGHLNHSPGTWAHYPPIHVVGEHQIMQRMQQSSASGRPCVCACRVKTPDQGVGTRYELLLHPVPDGEYTITYRYHINPEMLGEEAALPFGGQAHAQTIVEACLSAAEELNGVGNGMHQQRFLDCLRSSVSHDRNVSAPKTLGYNHDPSDRPFVDGYFDWHDCDENIVTYNGRTY